MGRSDGSCLSSRSISCLHHLFMPCVFSCGHYEFSICTFSISVGNRYVRGCWKLLHERSQAVDFLSGFCMGMFKAVKHGNV